MTAKIHNSVNLDIEMEIRKQLSLLGTRTTASRNSGSLSHGPASRKQITPMPSSASVGRWTARLWGCMSAPSVVRPACMIWRPTAGSRPRRSGGNCAKDSDIEYITALVYDVDVVSPQRQRGHPASDDELERTLFAAQLLSRQEGLALSSAIVCTGNGHQVWAPIVPVSVDGTQVALQFKLLCELIAAEVAGKVDGVRIDPIYNLSRVARAAGSWNLKGSPCPVGPTGGPTS